MKTGSLRRLAWGGDDAERPLPRPAPAWADAGPCGGRKGLGLRVWRCGRPLGSPFGGVPVGDGLG